MSDQPVDCNRRPAGRLHAAIREGDLPSVCELLRLGVDANRRDTDGFTPLMLACALGQPYMAEMLLVAHADVLAIDPRMGATALHKAAQTGNVDVIAALLNHGAFIDQQSPVLGNTALMDAVLHKHRSAVQCLLDRGARTTIRNHWQQSALDLARVDRLEAIARLIEARIAADAERVGAMSLVSATKAGDLAEVERLIAAGAVVDEQVPVVGGPDDNYTALGIAAREGQRAIARALLGAGADPSRMIGLMKGTALHEAAYFGHAELVQELVAVRERSGASIPEIDAQGPYNGLSALHDAVWHGHLEAARVLVGAGARLDLRTNAGLTPRELARLYGYDEIVEFLAGIEPRLLASESGDYQ
ncbi:ankyrin repeat domain-containing protein [Variovorax boronicumulans]|uniref:ankyrin repeat domain-containing protein n=1 Tax=Variovorax boronicumulans TaxID=436515 RepID=UPI001C5A3788